jgi:hypothetical protein
VAIRFPCLMCGKPVPKSRRDAGKDAWGCTTTAGECCSAKCLKALDAESAADMAAEARTLGPIEDGTAMEWFRDYEFHSHYPNE